MCKEYNGYTNYQTWAVSLWLDNDQGTYEMLQEWAEESREDAEEMNLDAVRLLSDRIQMLVNDNTPLYDASMFSDLLGYSISAVNFWEIAENILEE